jgi:hypothetical protein
MSCVYSNTFTQTVPVCPIYVSLQPGHVMQYIKFVDLQFMSEFGLIHWPVCVK